MRIKEGSDSLPSLADLSSGNQSIHRRGHRLQRRGGDVAVAADTEQRRAVWPLELDIGNRFGGRAALVVAARRDRMFAVIDEIDGHAGMAGKRVYIGIDRSGAAPLDLDLPVAVMDGGSQTAPLAAMRVRQGTVTGKAEAARGLLQICVVEGLPDQLRRDLLAGAVGDLLDHLAELDLQPARQFEPVILLEHIGDAALARLAVDADHRF